MFISDAPATTDTTNTSAKATSAKASPSHDATGIGTQGVLDHVEKLIAPVWPLADYVAVNPFLGLADRTFLDARRRLRAVSDAEMLMPLGYYRQQFASGQITEDDISEALQELNVDTYSPRLSVDEVVKKLRVEDEPAEKSEATERLIQPVCETVDQVKRSNWSQHVKTEIGRHCGAHYDEGQAAWPNPWKYLPLYAAWKAAQRIDRRADALGIPMFRNFVKSLPDVPAEAIEHMLRRLGVPEDLWEDLLLCTAYTVPGWAAWTRYQGEMAHRSESSNDDFIGLLAIRLAYDVAVGECSGVDIDWQAIAKTRSLVSRAGRPVATNDADVRFVLLRASEIAWQRNALAEMNPDGPENPTEPSGKRTQLTAQMVFCIDVRSERYRRHLEGASADVATYGFAGFFGVPMAVQGFEEDVAASHVPALLSPSFVVEEGLRDTCKHEVSHAKQRRSFTRFLRKTWKQFSSSAVSCFGFVETSGLAYGWKLFKKSTFGEVASSRFDGIGDHHTNRLGPDVSKLQKAGVSTEQQVDIAESILRGIGITQNFAQLVVFCGHAATSQNNPLQAGLECGACCGHSGEPNARLAAKMLNQSFVREGLAERGIEVPDDTKFVAAVHDTTTDDVQFYDTGELVLTAGHALEHLRKATERATQMCRLERLPSLNADDPEHVVQRAKDWSEVRPEWGLAGNAAFVIGPRSLTANTNLSGRSFLHSYDYRNDPEFAVLEQIMTAPMVVAHWINMQYYASAVDNKTFGSGTKTLHNVVGHFGVYSGNGGDLTTGLAWESLHDGTKFIHEPLRLLSVIAAPREAVANIIERHENVGDLVTNGWLNLVVVDEGHFYRFTPQRTWQQLDSSETANEQLEVAMTPQS